MARGAREDARSSGLQVLLRRDQAQSAAARDHALPIHARNPRRPRRHRLARRLAARGPAVLHRIRVRRDGEPPGLVRSRGRARVGRLTGTDRHHQADGAGIGRCALGRGAAQGRQARQRPRQSASRWLAERAALRLWRQHADRAGSPSGRRCDRGWLHRYRRRQLIIGRGHAALHGARGHRRKAADDRRGRICAWRDALPDERRRSIESARTWVGSRHCERHPPRRYFGCGRGSARSTDQRRTVRRTPAESAERQAARAVERSAQEKSRQVANAAKRRRNWATAVLCGLLVLGLGLGFAFERAESSARKPSSTRRCAATKR